MIRRCRTNATKMTKTMNEVANKSVLIYDRGLFLPLALRLAEDFEEVGSLVPNDSPFPLPYQTALGEGFDQIIRLPEFCRAIRMAVMMVFPDDQDCPIKEYLVLNDHQVWNSLLGKRLIRRRISIPLKH